MTESKLLVENKQVVVPGQIIAEGMDYLPSTGTYRLNEHIRAQQLGLLIIDGKVLRTLPLAGRYLPKVNDVVIGRVEDILMSGWRLDINGPYSAVLPLKDASFDYIRKGEDLTNYFDLDDYVVMKITQVTTQNLIDTTVRGPGLRKLEGGRVIVVNAFKVPRVIGKRGSMVSMLKGATSCQIVVGQNGLIWVSGEPEKEVIAYEAIRMIEAQAHVPGLTERIKTFLEKRTGGKVAVPEFDAETEEQQKASTPREGPRGSPRPQNRGPRRGPPRPQSRGPQRRGPRK